MNELKTTNGPWKAVKPQFTDPRFVRHIEDSRGYLVGRVNFANRIQSEVEAIANAELMADAPELFNALAELSEAAEESPLGDRHHLALENAKSLMASHLVPPKNNLTQTVSGGKGVQAGASAQPQMVVVEARRIEVLHSAIRALLEGLDGPQDPLALEVRQALDLVQTKPLMQVLRSVRGDQRQRNDQVLMVCPPGMSDETAAYAVKRAVHYAGVATADGTKTQYIDVLRRRFALEGGDLIAEPIPELKTNVAWDEGFCPEEPKSLPMQGNEQWARVGFTNADGIYAAAEGQLSDGQLLDGSSTVRLQAERDTFAGFVTKFVYRYPDAEQYGVPPCATLDGAREFIVDVLGFVCSRDLDLVVEDTGDDSLESFEVECVVPRKLLVHVESTPRERDKARQTGG